MQENDPSDIAVAGQIPRRLKPGDLFYIFQCFSNCGGYRLGFILAAVPSDAFGNEALDRVSEHPVGGQNSQGVAAPSLPEDVGHMMPNQLEYPAILISRVLGLGIQGKEVLDRLL